jgi:hypothetical protein
MIETKSQTFSDETIRRFLLGRLDPAEQSGFEYSLFVDETLEERVRLAELELSDDYTANRLSHAERNLFRQRFLLTADRETELQVSKSLHHNFADSHSIARSGFWPSVVDIFDVRRHAWKYAFATLALMLLMFAIALLIKREPPRIANPFRPPKPTPRASGASSPLRTNHSTNAPAPSHGETSPTLPLHEGLTTSVVLDSKTTLDSAPTIATNGDSVTVQLRLDDPLADAYDVNIMTMNGESVFSASAVQRAEENTLSFEVPATTIKQGDFQIVLARVDGDASQRAGTYYFRVR